MRIIVAFCWMQNNNLLYSYLAPLTTNLYQFVGEFFPQVLLVHIGPYPELLLVNVTTFWQSNMAMENSPSIYIDFPIETSIWFVNCPASHV